MRSAQRINYMMDCTTIYCVCQYRLNMILCIQTIRDNMSHDYAGRSSMAREVAGSQGNPRRTSRVLLYTGHFTNGNAFCLHLDKCRRRTARAISLFRESYRSGRQCAFARLSLKSRIAQPGNTRSKARAQELARSGLEFGLERVVFADGNSYNIFVRVLWNFLSHT